MTTLVSLAARDFAVVACDSLATYSRRLVDPSYLTHSFFDGNGLKLDSSGAPLLTNPSQIWSAANAVPVNQLPSVTKIFDLKPRKVALLFAGAARINDLSVKNIVESFRQSQKFKKYANYTVKGLAERLRDYLVDQYMAQFPQETHRPSMEIIVTGYSLNKREAEVYRINIRYDWDTLAFLAEVQDEVLRGQYNVVLGGQYDVIQRVVFGIDLAAFVTLGDKSLQILQNYRKEIQDSIDAAGIQFAVPAADPSKPQFDLFGTNFGGIKGILSEDLGGLSEQAGIDFVTFLVQTMIKSQEFSSSLPTVGGDIHVGIVTADDGFRWISKEEYKFSGHTTPKFKHD